MPETFRFPNGGYDVTVCRRKDIIDSIDSSIVDKEVLDTVIEQCEKDVESFLSEGVWTGVPYLGNMRVPKNRQKFKEINGVELLETAKQTLDEQQYNAFKKELNIDVVKNVARERLYRYQTSMFVTKHRWQYKMYVKDKRIANSSNKDAFARFMCYSCITLAPYKSEE